MLSRRVPEAGLMLMSFSECTPGNNPTMKFKKTKQNITVVGFHISLKNVQWSANFEYFAMSISLRKPLLKGSNWTYTSKCYFYSDDPYRCAPSNTHFEYLAGFFLWQLRCPCLVANFDCPCPLLNFPKERDSKGKPTALCCKACCDALSLLSWKLRVMQETTPVV